MIADDERSVVAPVVGTSRCDVSPRRPQRAVPTIHQRTGAFTLTELVLTTGVLVLLVFLFTQLFNSAATVTVLGYKKMDADSEARQVFDRMGFDFAQMVKRKVTPPDVNYFLKYNDLNCDGCPPAGCPTAGSVTDCGACVAQTGGNDRAAFYSTVAGYYPTPTAIPTGTPIGASPVSLISYRINSNSGSSSYNKMERMSKGLAWNGAVPNVPPLPLNSSLTPMVFLPQRIDVNWPAAADPSAPDSNYEVVGPQVFRFEYYYLLTNGKLSDIPWDCGAGHNAVNGMQDIAAIVADIAVIDPSSKVLVTDCQLAQLNGAPLPQNCTTPQQYPVLIDWGNSSCAGCPDLTQWQQTPGLLLAQWRAAIDANTISLPLPAISGIRVYERYFYLTH